MPVYFIQAGGPTGPVKIGYGDAQGRLTDCQVGNHLELRIIRQFEGGLPEEIALHARFDDLWIRGEWHNFTRAMLGDVGLVEIFAPAPEPLPPIEVAVGIPLGQRIAFARNRARLSQREVATALCVSPGAVAQWETVSKGIRTQRLSALASLLDVSIGWLVAGDVQSQPSEAAEPQAAE